MFRRVILVYLYFIFVNLPVFSYGCSLECPEIAQKYRIYMNRIYHERAVVSNALNLTDEQVKKREELICKNNPLYEKKFEELIRESYKIKALKCAGASECDILKQKRIVNKIQKDIQSIVDGENKVFKKCLTGAQRTKFVMIKKLEKNDLKKASHQKDYYKSNPQMRRFGNPVPNPCDEVCPCN